MKENNNSHPSPPFGGTEGASYRGIRRCRLHRRRTDPPAAESPPLLRLSFANSESNAGNLVSDVHEGLIGEMT